MSSRSSLYLGEEPYRSLPLEPDFERSSDDAAQTATGDQPAISGWCNSRFKRWFDLSLTLPAILLFSPLLAGISIAIKLTSRGPVFFRQPRVGRDQVAFIIVKFRTMSHLAEDSGPSVTRCGDPRLTPLGSFLRRSKLDELPQLFTVLRGEMSLVGPRPKLARHEKMSMACRPGITGAATLVFCNEERMLAAIPEPMVEQHAVEVFNPMKVRLDQEYQRNASLATDVLILARTLLGAKGSLLVQPIQTNKPAFEDERMQSAEISVYDDQNHPPYPVVRPLFD